MAEPGLPDEGFGIEPDPSSSSNPFDSAGFGRWWLASMVAGTGVGIQTVTVPLFVRDRVDDEVRALAISGVLVAQSLPGACLALVGGAIADRVERRRILVWTYSLAASVAAVYVLLSGFDVREVWPVFPLAALVGSAAAFTNPTRQSMLPLLVSRAQLQNGVILGTMGFMGALQFLGPTVAGLVVDWRGLTQAFGLEVLLIAAGAFAFSGVRPRQPPPSVKTVVADLVEGLRYAAGHPAIWGLLLLAATIPVVFIGPFSVTVPIMVPDVHAAPDKWVGILWGCFGFGVFAGSVMLTQRPLPRRGLAVCLTIFCGGLTQLLYGLSEVLLVSAALQVVSGLNASVFVNYVVTLLQQHTEPRMMGRVMSMYTLAFFGAMPLGYTQAGFVTRTFGPQTTLVMSGLVAMAVGLTAVALLRPVRSLP
ncbi:MAG: MFS transporter [Myxococcota bacterium]|nr:MFS transporter [Myxococcota bacterium]